MNKLLIFLVILLQVNVNMTFAQIENGDFKDYVQRLDTDGNPVNAHHGGILYHEGKYWWYGQDHRETKGTDKTDVGIVLYSSDNLYDWKSEGVILACEPSGDLQAPMSLERAKVIYNEKTKKFVMWFHYIKGQNGVDVGTSDAGVAVCDSINGTYKFLGYHRPLGNDWVVKDCMLFKDADDTGYFIFDTYPTDKSIDPNIYIAKLSDDYLKTVDIRKIDALKWREAPAMIKKDGYYYMITSGRTGWNPNPAKVHRAKNIFGPWTDLGDPCIGPESETTFNSQSTFILQIEGKENAYIYMGDRWNTANMIKSSHIWLPFEVSDEKTIQLKYLKSWDLGVF